MKAVRLTHSCWLNDRVHGDTGAILFLEDDEAHGLIVVGLGMHAPEHEIGSGPEAAQEIPVAKRADAPTPDEVLDQADISFVGPEAAAARMQELVDLTEELGLYDIPADDAAAALEEARHGQPEMTRPWTTAAKADWISWAVHGNHGQPPTTAENAALLTKSQLMSRYGERL
jgi:hypothetical protein